jgi:hypothetical protein
VKVGLVAPYHAQRLVVPPPPKTEEPGVGDLELQTREILPAFECGASGRAHGDLMAQRDRFQHQRGAGSELASGGRQCSACQNRHER